MNYLKDFCKLQTNFFLIDSRRAKNPSNAMLILSNT